MFKNILNKYFSSLGGALSKSFVRYTSGVISSCSFSTHEIARYVSKETEKDFNTSEKGLNYLLSNPNFKIDDSYWRNHINMIFDLLSEQELIKKNEKIYIQVDFTSNKNYFLILVASIILNNRSIPIYFTMRNYPNHKEQYNHKKMESAFLKGLKHVLSKKYKYVIVADRGFGNQRFIELCEKTGFEYLIRGIPNLKIKYNNSKDILEKICDKDEIYEVEILKWCKTINVYRSSNEKGVWFLFSNIKYRNYKDAASNYADRFKIEKCFQDLKSSGFNVEKTKIRKYSNYKRLLAIAMVAHCLLVLLGHIITVKMPKFLKNSALMASVVLAYFLSEKKLQPYLQKNS